MSVRTIIHSKSITLTPAQRRQEYDTCLLANEVLNLRPQAYASLPQKAFIQPASNEALSNQIAIPGGLHTCDMTVTTNAFIWQGWLTAKQGKKIHDEFTGLQPSRNFTQRIISGKPVLIASREEAAISTISGERLYWGMLPQAEKNEEDITARVLGALAAGIVLNIGDGGHARLAVGYHKTEGSSELLLSNPYNANELEIIPLRRALSFHPSNAIMGVARKTESLSYLPHISFEPESA